jgi:CHASE1-domain containing sensor protein
MHSDSRKKVSHDTSRSVGVLLGIARFIPWLVLAFCLALSWLLWNATQHQTQIKMQDSFDFRVRQATSLTKQRVLAQVQILHGARGLFISSYLVERNEFRDYVTALNLDKHYPGILGVGYAQIVPRAEISKHTEAVRKESGHPEYRVHPEGKRALYTSIVYLEPFSSRNLRAFG